MAIGYACVQAGGEAARLSALRLANASPDNLRRVTQNNLRALRAMIQYNAVHQIRLFRISSDIVPFASHPAVENVDWRTEFKETLLLIGEEIKNNGIRVSMHPGQYTVLNSPDARVVHNAVEDLRYHSALLDALGCDTAHKIIVHIGGVYADKPLAMKRFVQNYTALDERIKARLVIENDDTSYTAEDVMQISELTGLPVVFDYFHHQLNHTENSPSPFDWIARFAQTWGEADGRQKIHYSQGNPNAAGGAHSQSIDVAEFLAFYNGLPREKPDIMLEVKDKNLSAVKCILATVEHLRVSELEKEWARYKYLVLGKSAAIYNQIRALLKDKASPNAVLFYQLIDEALAMGETKGAQVNAARHVWGYVRKEASAAQQKRFQTLLDAYANDVKSLKALKSFLFGLAKRQQIKYLLDSLYFYL